MENPNLSAQHPSAGHGENDRLLIACSFWLRVGFVGASILVAGLLLLFNGEAKPLLAMASAAGGGLLAAVAWKRGRVLLDRVDGADAAFPAAALAAVRNHPLEPIAKFDRRAILGAD